MEEDGQEIELNPQTLHTYSVMWGVKLMLCYVMLLMFFLFPISFFKYFYPFLIFFYDFLQTAHIYNKVIKNKAK